MVERAFYAAVKRLMTDPIDGLLMAVSGGVDSMVMAHLLLRWIETPEGSRICSRTAIAHMNFSLRGEESDKDSGFVESWAKKKSYSFFQKNGPYKRVCLQKGNFPGNGCQRASLSMV